MAELSIVDKCKLAAGLVVQTPPGEINDVINDIRAIVADDDALMPQVVPALRSYNLAQLQVVEHAPSNDIPAHTSLLSDAAILPGSASEGKERYIDPEGKTSFAFDHVTLTVSDYQPYNLPEEEETLRAELAKSLAAYSKNHFPSSYSTVTTSQYPLLPPAPAPPVVTQPEEPSAIPVEEKEGLSETPAADDEAKVNVTENEAEPLVTDVVQEQVGTGELEPAPTPAMGEGEAEKEEVDVPGGLEKVDEKVEEAIEQEGATDEPKVEEEGSGSKGPEKAVEAEAEVEAAAVVPPIDERKQERLENPTYTLQIVGNRYNPNNFWTGRWRTSWVVDKAAGKVEGSINVDVHYYEQGNVQMATTHNASFPYPNENPNGSQSIASQIVTTISKLETAYHTELNDVYNELGDKAFRALRRALPVTRQKMDWEKVSGYSLGSDLTKARG